MSGLLRLSIEFRRDNSDFKVRFPKFCYFLGDLYRLSVRQWAPCGAYGRHAAPNRPEYPERQERKRLSVLCIRS